MNHDLLNHAPFFNLDIIVCRNVMIYFNKKQQNETVTNFYESLKEIDLIFNVSAQLITNKASMKIKKKWCVFQPLG